MAKHRTRRGGVGILSRFNSRTYDAPIQKDEARLMGTISNTGNRVRDEFRKGSLDNDNNLGVEYTNPMMKGKMPPKKGGRKTRRKSRTTKKVSRRR